MNAGILVVRVLIERPEDRCSQKPRWRRFGFVDQDGARDAVLTPSTPKDALQLPRGDGEDLAAAWTTPVDGRELGHGRS
jgi:hypothetical protein